MAQNLLRNGGFEADWGEESSHHVRIFPVGAAPYETDIGNIATPPGWVVWFRHDPGTWDQPESRDAWDYVDEHRVHSGRKGYLIFTFYRKHDAGLMQQVHVQPGTRLRLTAWAHAWSNCQGRPNTDDPRWSEGPGHGPGFLLEGDEPPTDSPGTADDWRNFTFYVGIDPTGGTNPFADTVVWGRGAHIYNEYAQVPPVEAVAQGDTVTVFLRSKTLWPFKHNDAYWDDAELVIVGAEEPPEHETTPSAKLSHRPDSLRVGDAVTLEARSLAGLTNVHLTVRQPSGDMLPVGDPKIGRDGNQHTWTYTVGPLKESGEYQATFTASGGVLTTHSFQVAPAPTDVEPSERGRPRVQYERTYVLLPPGASVEWALAAVDGTWEDRHYTIGSSADDAGMGDLDKRRVIAVNPGLWPSDLRDFFARYYPGVEYVPLEAASPDDLRAKLRQM